jgi:hypothetical protein
MCSNKRQRNMRMVFLVILIMIGMAPSFANAQTELLIFGGRGHDVFLGCLSCSRFDSDSVLNKFGTYGSQYSSDSIWNRYGTYGGSYGTYSPCNRYSSNPPVVVDRSGNFYGYLTINPYQRQRLTDRTVAGWLESEVCK